LGVNLID
jgi:phosphatidylinositol 4-kinase A